MATEWEQERSNFNHAWLKNRLVVGLMKCLRVLSGHVEDREAWQSLSSVTRDWKTMSGRVNLLLDFAERRTSLPIEPERIDAEVLGIEPSAYLLEVERRVWLHRNKAVESIALARSALGALDSALADIGQFLGAGYAPSRDSIEACLSAARELGDAFSKLTVPRDRILA